MSLSEANSMIKKLQLRIEELESALRERDMRIEGQNAQLDKMQSVLNFHDHESQLTSSGDGKTSVFRQRGIGISAEPTQQHSLHNIQLVKHSKDPKQQQLIEGAIVGNEFLKKLDRAQIEDIVECMAPRSCKQGDLIIREGDVGNELFVIEVGAFDVFRGTSKVREMKPGQLFGELAILYNCTRTASIRAVSDGKLFVIERKVFQNVMMKTTMTKQIENTRALKKLGLFGGVGDDLLGRLGDTLEERHCAPSEFIIRHGAHGTRAYYLQEGTCDIDFNDGSRAVVERGHWFAQEILQDQESKIDNVVCRGNCVCLILAKDSYQQMVASTRAALDSPPIPADSKNISDEFDRSHLSVEDFEYVATLGVGGFGRVELVRYKHGSTLKTYALKTLKKRHIVETRQQEHVMNEKNIMFSCNSHFIVSLHATFRDAKFLYMVFEACLGGELWTILRDYSHFDDGTTRFYTACVIEAFQYLHNKGIIYRDLKPENLLLDASGYSKLCDFGFSKVIGTGKTWTFCGTPEYVPPEIILNKGHDFAADYWSLGILMFELLTGNPPFVGSDPMKTYNIILKGVDMIHFPSKKISRTANQLIRRLCKPNPAERLGAQKGGIREIKKNKWFEGFNWEGLSHRRLQPPIIKSITSPVDMSNFDKYERTNESPPPDDFSGWDKDF